MIPEIGHFALILALCFAVLQVVFAAAQNKNAMNCSIAQFVCIVISFLILEYAFITNDFSVQYVTHHSHTDLPLMYRISALWGGHEGSLLLWVLMLSTWGTLAAWMNRKIEPKAHRVFIAVLGVLSVGFLSFIEFTSNPFLRYLPLSPENGQDLNPLLQDPALVIHPPLLYMGYVGFSVAFAFAITALIMGKFDQQWARMMRPWTLIAWMFLSLGIVIGSYWAYYVLGWGGWWFWDPVENASFMPWLLGCALIHSLAVVEKRNTFKRWTLLLAITTFLLCLLGTFLVRSGILTSVHAFANDPERGFYILIFLSLVMAGSIFLYALRASYLKNNVGFDYLSRESFLLLNNLLLTLACATVFLGTMYPLFLEMITHVKISVGPPYFSTVFVPMMVVLVFFMALAPQTKFKHTDFKEWLMRLSLPMIIACVSAGIIGIKMPFGVILTVLLSVLIILSLIEHRQNLGMSLAHLGVALLLLGIGVSKQLEVETDQLMAIGDTVSVKNYDFTFKELKQERGPNYDTSIAGIVIEKNHKEIAILHPEKRRYDVSGIYQSQTAIDAGLFRDLYVALGEQLSDNKWSVRIYYKPFIRFIWLGGILIAIGAFIAACDKRYRMRKG